MKFSFERYRGVRRVLKDKVAGVDILDPSRVRFASNSPGRTS